MFMRRLYSVLAASAIFVLSSCGSHGPENGMTLPAPGNVKGTVTGENSVMFTWDRVEAALQYQASLADAVDTSDVVNPVIVDAASVSFDGLEQGRSYICRVRAINGMEYSGFALSEALPLPSAASGTEPEMPEAGAE